MQPLSGNQRPDLLTSLMDMSLVQRLPREMHLSRSSANTPRLPSFLEMLQNPHVLLTFDKVHNPLRLPRKTTQKPYNILFIKMSQHLRTGYPGIRILWFKQFLLASIHPYWYSHDCHQNLLPDLALSPPLRFPNAWPVVISGCFVCVCVCIYIYVYVYVYVCVYVYVYVYMYMCIFVYVYICMWVYACMYVCMCMYAFMYVCMYVCVCTYTYMYIYIHIYSICRKISSKITKVPIHGWETILS